MSEKKLFLLDAYALIFRAYYAVGSSPRFTSSGINTSAIFGFVNTLEDVLRKENPTHIAVCFDPAGPTFRHEMYAEYKAGRESTPEAIKEAVPYIKDIIKAYNIPVMEVAGYEADDVIGTLAVKSRGKSFDTYIMSPDKDLSQLVDDTVRIYRPGYKGQPAEVRGEKEVCEIFGIDRPEQVIDILALMGDKADNIKGCPGVGEKTASKLVKEWGSVERLIANTPSLKGALRQKVEENIDSITFSKTLATICTDVPLDFDEHILQRKPINADAIREIFTKLEFRTLLSRVLGEQANPAPKINRVEKLKSEPTMMGSLFDFPTEEEVIQLPKCVVVSSADADAIVVKILREKRVAIFPVIKGTEAMTATIRGIAVIWGDNSVFFPASLLQYLKPLLQSEKIEKVGIELKRTIVALRRKDVQFSAPYYDVAVAHYLLQPEMSRSLERLCDTYLHYSLPEMPVDDNPADVAAIYARACLQLADEFAPMLDAEGVTSLLYDVELPLIEVLADMEYSGVRVDVKALNAYSLTLTERLRIIEDECHQMAGRQFNVSSPAQVGEVLFGDLHLDTKVKRTKTGQYSTTEEILEKMRHKHIIVGKILEFRKVKKLLSTYVNALPALINPQTGKIHTTFNQTVTATGRLSSTNPNLQNIPIRNDDGKEIRKAFIPDEGHLFFSADYSQIELRIVANISNDKAMVEAFLAGEDIHRATAAKIFHKTIADVTEDERRKAKTANFGMVYGISAFGMAERLQISRSEAKEIIDGYFATFPGVKTFMEASVEEAKKKGFVTTLFGRRRMLADINSRNAVVRGYAERNAINAPIQGTAADIIKIAMISVWRRMKNEGLMSKMILQVHDELNFDVIPSELPIVERIVKEEMENAYSGIVPLVASCGVGANWLEAH